jgi:hypothetical protein
MALQDQLLFGVYVGLVIESNDPDNLGRVKIYVPGKNGHLYTGWSDNNQDFQFASTTPDLFSEDILSRLKTIIPWARPAMPLWGGGTGSFTETSTGQPYVIPVDNAYQGTGELKMPALKDKTVNLNGVDKNLLKNLEKFGGAFPNAVITSAKDGNHGPNSLHNDGRAIDIRVWDMVDGKRITKSDSEIRAMVEWWATEGGATEIGYEVNSSSPHLHIGYNRDGKRDSFNVGSTPSWWADFSKAHDSGKLAASSSQQGPTDNRITADDGVNRVDGKIGEAYPVGTGSSGIPQAANGNVTKTDLYNGVLSYLKNRPSFNRKNVNGNYIAPTNGTAFGVDGSPESWANYMTKIAWHESTNNANLPFKYGGAEGSYGSGGLFQIGDGQVEDWARQKPELAKAWGFTPGYDYPTQDFYSADFNTRGYLFITEALMENQGYSIGTQSNPLARRGANGTIGEATREKLLNNAPTGDVSSDGNRMVQLTTNQGVNAYPNSNMSRAGAPVGMFSIPAVGAKVWVMFEGGSPNRPVYMGQANDPSNIQAIS